MRLTLRSTLVAPPERGGRSGAVAAPPELLIVGALAVCTRTRSAPVGPGETQRGAKEESRRRDEAAVVCTAHTESIEISHDAYAKSYLSIRVERVPRGGSKQHNPQSSDARP